MCKRRFLDIDILGPTCQLSLRQERSGEQHRKKYWQSLTTSVLFVLKSFVNSLLYVMFRSALRHYQRLYDGWSARSGHRSNFVIFTKLLVDGSSSVVEVTESHLVGRWRWSVQPSVNTGYDWCLQRFQFIADLCTGLALIGDFCANKRCQRQR